VRARRRGTVADPGILGWEWVEFPPQGGLGALSGPTRYQVADSYALGWARKPLGRPAPSTNGVADHMTPPSA
jgi:hypothetical protein